MQYRYEVTPLASQKIWTFYRNVAKKYYAYSIHEDVITIEDACHEQNMYE